MAIKITDPKLVFHYDPAPQRSLEWLERKRGKIGASRIGDWLAVSKAKATTGKPLKARLDYEKELMFERQFGVSFNNFISEAMQDGIDFEDFARSQFEQIHGVVCTEVGCWYNEYMAVSPDRQIEGKEQGIEIKIVRDNTFVDVLMDGVPRKHWEQIQCQLLATGWEKIFYVCLNFTTKKLAIIEVLPDDEFQQYVLEAIQEELVTEPFALDEVHDIIGELPDWSRDASAVKRDLSDSNTSNGGW
jgi:predicted phage-related endonuclease